MINLKLKNKPKNIYLISLALYAIFCIITPINFIVNVITAEFHLWFASTYFFMLPFYRFGVTENPLEILFAAMLYFAGIFLIVISAKNNIFNNRDDEPFAYGIMCMFFTMTFVLSLAAESMLTMSVNTVVSTNIDESEVIINQCFLVTVTLFQIVAFLIRLKNMSDDALAEREIYRDLSVILKDETILLRRCKYTALFVGFALFFRLLIYYTDFYLLVNSDGNIKVAPWFWIVLSALTVGEICFFVDILKLFRRFKKQYSRQHYESKTPDTYFKKSVAVQIFSYVFALVILLAPHLG